MSGMSIPPRSRGCRRLGRDQGHLRRRRLEHDIGEGLRARDGTTTHRAARKGAARRLRSRERHPAVQAEPASEALEAGLLGTAADDQRAARKDRLVRGQGLEQHIDAL